LNSLVAQDCANLEIIVVDDGSTDDTADVAARFAAMHPQITVMTKPNGGKASALNHGIANSTGEIIVAVDADSVLNPDAVRQLVLPLHERDVVAVAGHVRVANLDETVTRQQAGEYLTGQALMRSAFAEVESIQVIPGPVGAFRRTALLAVGGYSEDTLVEDMDLTITLAAAGGRIVYNPEAIAHTEAPGRVKDLVNQRRRWTRGGFQVLGKHKEMIFNSEHGALGNFGLPYFLIGPWLDILITIWVGLTVVLVLTGVIATPWLTLGLMLLIPALMYLWAARMYGESKRLAFEYALMVFSLRFVIGWATVLSGLAFLRGSEAKWGTLQRTGGNVLPGQAAQAGGGLAAA
jgi:peptidoglycan-N-acetylglucosamine deacetylase